MIKDLIILCADKNMEACLSGLIPRFETVYPEIRPFTFDQPYVHPGHDGGARAGAHFFLRPFTTQYKNALVVLDFEGSGTKKENRIDLESEIDSKLNENGWDGRAKAIVIEPELENWMWTNSPHMARAIDFNNLEELDEWLVNHNFKKQGDLKPFRPKEAMEAALRLKRRQLSSSIHKQISQRSSFLTCHDPAFLKLVETFKAWYPQIENPQSEQLSLVE